MSSPAGAMRPHLSRADLRRMRENLSAPQPSQMTQSSESDREEPLGRILTVCTGNICRSPMAEVLLRAGLGETRVQVRSAGTHGLVGHEMTAQAQALAVERGADAADTDAHRARLLVEPMLNEADLILTMSREHRSAAVQLAPQALRRAFTVREFARLSQSLSDAQVQTSMVGAGSGPGARLRALAQLVGAQRGLVPAAPDDDDVIDPYRRSDATYRLSADQLTPAISEALRVIRTALV